MRICQGSFLERIDLTLPVPDTPSLFAALIDPCVEVKRPHCLIQKSKKRRCPGIPYVRNRCKL